MKTYKIVISPDAAGELEAITDFVARDSSARARKLVSSLLQVIRELKTFPLRGKKVELGQDEAGLEARYLTYKGYLVFYRIVANEVRILHVAGPGQNWPVLFF